MPRAAAAKRSGERAGERGFYKARPAGDADGRRCAGTSHAPVGPMRRTLHDNGLSIAVLTLFLLSWLGQLVFGHLVYDEVLREHGQAPLALAAYLRSGHFLEATGENWESEFLQMAMYVILTAVFRQRGSSESKPLDGPAEVDRDPRAARFRADAPWPVRRGGLWLRLYEHSLSLAFGFLFLFSFGLHVFGGVRLHRIDALAHGEPPMGILDYLASAQLWFESFQNWQSEFLSLAAMVVLSIFLRQRGSPESKPVDAPHSETGG